MPDLADILADRYAAGQRRAPRPLWHWPVILAAALALALICAALGQHIVTRTATERAAFEQMKGF